MTEWVAVGGGFIAADVLRWQEGVAYGSGAGRAGAVPCWRATGS